MKPSDLIKYEMVKRLAGECGLTFTDKNDLFVLENPDGSLDISFATCDDVYQYISVFFEGYKVGLEKGKK